MKNTIKAFLLKWLYSIGTLWDGLIGTLCLGLYKPLTALKVAEYLARLRYQIRIVK